MATLPPEPSNGQIDYSSIKLAAEKWRAESKAQPTPADKIAEDFERALLECDIVSFDLFDTLVVREVNHPVEVFQHLTVAAGLLRDPRIQGRIVDIRFDAEKNARQALFARIKSGEVVLGEIYDVFCRMIGHPPSDSAALAAAEEAVELKLCRANPPIQRLFERALAAGKKVVVISDTYHRQEFLVQLLQASNLTVPAGLVFASSRHRVSKQGGQLFSLVLAQLGVQPDRILHVGDHPVSDFKAPRQLGIPAILHPFAISADRPDVAPATPAATTRSWVRSRSSFNARCGERRNDFWWLLGHNAFGPLITGFCQWLERSFRADGINRAYFLLRDGEIFYRVHSILFPPGTGVPVRTLLSSRRAFVFPLLESAPKFVLSNLLSGITPRPAGEYLARLDIPVQLLADEFRASGFMSLDEVVDARQDLERFGRLFQRPRVTEVLINHSRRELSNVNGFLRSQGIYDAGKIALVDLGWQGSIHKAIYLLQVQAGIKPDLYGYYLGTFRTFMEYMPAQLKVASYLLHLSEPARVASILSPSRELLEIICSTEQGSLLGFGNETTAFAPHFQANHAGPQQLEHLASIHQGVLAFAHQFVASRSALELVDIPAELAGENLLRLIAEPTKQEAGLVGALSHGEDGGSINRRYAARFRPESQTPQMLLEDHKTAFWKAGLLNQPSPKAAALRMLLWLAQD